MLPGFSAETDISSLLGQRNGVRDRIRLVEALGDRRAARDRHLAEHQHERVAAVAQRALLLGDRRRSMGPGPRRRADGRSPRQNEHLDALEAVDAMGGVHSSSVFASQTTTT